MTSAVESLTGKGKTIGCGNQCIESMPRTDRIGGGKDLKTTNHCVGG
jgi:hypothetical protein